MFPTVENIETYILCSIRFSSSEYRAFYGIMWENMVQLEKRKMKTKYGACHEIRICNNHNLCTVELLRQRPSALRHSTLTVLFLFILSDNFYPLNDVSPIAVVMQLIYSRVCYNERSYNERMPQRTVLSVKSGCYKEHICYNKRGGILSADVARACACRIGPSRFD